MMESKGSRPELTLVLERFPEEASRIRRFYLADENFRDICADYATALETHQRLLGAPTYRNAPEIADYASVIAGLEAEIEEMLAFAK